MGLDMYLEARFYLSPYEANLALIRKAIGDAIGYMPPTERPHDDPTLMEITGVTVRVGYWRKCHPLNRWFVNNVQDGSDDCRPAFVSPDVLAELDVQLDQVKDDPESAGEHFTVEDDGALNMDDVDYMKVLVHAKRLQEQGWDIYYRASR